MNKERLERRRAFNEAMRARIRLIAQERNLPNSEIKWMGRLEHYDLMCFAERHRLSYDWLLWGDLKGLLRTVRNRQSASSSAAPNGQEAESPAARRSDG